jgi:hypothetical protein
MSLTKEYTDSNLTGFSLSFDNFELMRELYGNDSTHKYSYLLIEKDVFLNCSNILVDYETSFSFDSNESNPALSDYYRDNIFYIRTQQDNLAVYLTPLKDKTNEIVLKVTVP